MTARARILVVDDKPNMRRLLAATLADLGDVVDAVGGAQAIELLGTGRFDIVVTDIKMPTVDGHGVLRATHALRPRPAVVLVTGFATLDSAIEAVRDGAADYVLKPFDSDALRATVSRLIEQATAPGQVVEAWQGMVGASGPMIDLRRAIEGVAGTETTTLVFGESGSGKALAARAIHACGPRAARPLVVVSCEALPASSLEVEIFGEGRSRIGGIERARGGTLVLAEIGVLRPSLQARLHEVLDRAEERRTTGRREPRVIATTRFEISTLIDRRGFRTDLAERLLACSVTVPPLRDRLDDVPTLTEWFLGGGAERWRLTEDASSALRSYVWPGNVRELRVVLDRARVVAAPGLITREDLALDLEPHATTVELTALTYREAVDRVRAEGIRRYLELLLARFGGNVAAAAAHADMERESFYRSCRKVGVNPVEFRRFRAGRST